MLIRVRYSAGTYDYVSTDFLDDLIRNNAITQFFRSGSWATVGIDPVRTNDMASVYTGPERRGELRGAPFGIGLAKPILKKAVYALLICLALFASILFGTVLSAIFCPSVELEDPYSQAEIDAHGATATR